VGVILAGYTQLSGAMLHAVVDAAQADVEPFRAKRLLNMDHIKRYMLVEKRNKSYPEDVRAVFEAEKQLKHDSVEFQNRKYRTDLKSAVLAKLTAIASAETHELRQYRDAVSDQAASYVKQAFVSSDRKQKDAILDAAIATIPTDVTRSAKEQTIDERIVSSLFDQYLSQRLTAKQLGIVSRVPALVAREEAGEKATPSSSSAGGHHH